MCKRCNLICPDPSRKPTDGDATASNDDLFHALIALWQKSYAGRYSRDKLLMSLRWCYIRMNE